MANELTWKLTVDPALAAQAMRSIAQEGKKTSDAVVAAIRHEAKEAAQVQKEIVAAYTARAGQQQQLARSEEAAWKQHEAAKLAATRVAEKQGESAVAASNQAKERLAQRMVAVRRQQEADLAANVKRFERERLQIATQNASAMTRLAKTEADTRIREGRRAATAFIASLREQAREAQRFARQQQAELARSSRVSSLAAGAAGGVSALIGVSAVSEIRNAASAWIDYASKLENTRIAFTTMLGSSQAAEAHLKELQAFALKTPFQFGELIDASQRMQALGFNAQQVIPILTDVGNAVAAAGGGSERLDRVVLALSQIQSKGKVMTQELNQLAESGIPAWRMMEEQLGKSRAELIKMVEQGQISSQVFLDAFQKFSQQNFGGLMEAQSKTFTGAMSNIKDALLATSATAFAPLYERLSENARAMAELSTNSKEFQQNLTTAGNQIIQVWDGVVEAFYVVRDVIGLVGAVATQIIGGLTHTFLALASAVAYVLHGLEALGRYIAGDFKGAHESAALAENALRQATDELTRAAMAQTAVAEQLGRIWTEAADRAAAAANKMRNAAIVASAIEGIGGRPLAPGELETGGSMGLDSGVLRRKTGGGGVSGGGGGGGRAKISEGQRLLNQLTDEYNRLQVKTGELTRAQAIDQELLSAKYAKTSDEILTQIRSLATWITIDEQTAEANKKKEAALKTLDAFIKRQTDSLKEARLQEDEWDREIRELTKTLADAGVEIKAETFAIIANNDAMLKAIGLTRERIALEQTRIDMATRERIATPERKQEQLERESGIERSTGEETRERTVTELGVWDEALGSIMSRMEDFHTASQLYVVGAFHGMAEAATDAVQAWILYGGSLGKALKQAVAAELAAISARAVVQAALHAAYAIGSLALGNFAAAGQHAIAAAKFAAVAALTGVAARGFAGSAAASGSATAGSAFQNATRVGSGSTAGQPTTIDVNRRSSAPTVMVTVKLQGDIATDALKTRVVDAVVESLDLNDPRLTTQVQGAARRA